MKLYRVSKNPDSKATAPLTPHWFASKGAAATFRASVVGSGQLARKDMDTTPVDVPTKKDELVPWLTERGV